MQIINYNINLDHVTYTVETENGHVFTHSLPKDTTSNNIYRYLEILSNNVDGANS
ncbi:hypothetical protein [Staphylococcus sp. NAM3COL9]|uniref:hypothetical protein n=1 Tax=Staphylococcus sp. NAM3COL9 TaxID=1667172 RepID=UPI000A5006AF|nr:hypothetical protein [Staphylococcus sp. NAM3COL9]